MAEIIMDSSSPIFTLDKQVLQFKINPRIYSQNIENNSDINNLPPASVCTLIVTNLTDNYIAFRSKTTKKELYVVNPPYVIIEPNKNQTIIMKFYMKTRRLPSGEKHKFKFEGIVIDESDINKPPKQIFDQVIRNNIKVKGNTCKCNVEFIEDNNYEPESENIEIENPYPNFNESQSIDISNNSMNPLRSTGMSDVYQSVSNFNMSEYQGASKNNNESNNLKNEYDKLKNKISELNTENGILKNKIEQIKIELEQKKKKKEYRYIPPDSKEIKISQTNTIIICFFSLLLGYFLTK
jgi:hypothetical protein